MENSENLSRGQLKDIKEIMNQFSASEKVRIVGRRAANCSKDFFSSFWHSVKQKISKMKSFATEKIEKIGDTFSNVTGDIKRGIESSYHSVANSDIYQNLLNSKEEKIDKKIEGKEFARDYLDNAMKETNADYNYEKNFILKDIKDLEHKKIVFREKNHPLLMARAGFSYFKRSIKEKKEAKKQEKAERKLNNSKKIISALSLEKEIKILESRLEPLKEVISGSFDVDAMREYIDLQDEIKDKKSEQESIIDTMSEAEAKKYDEQNSALQLLPLFDNSKFAENEKDEELVVVGKKKTMNENLKKLAVMGVSAITITLQAGLNAGAITQTEIEANDYLKASAIQYNNLAFESSQDYTFDSGNNSFEPIGSGYERSFADMNNLHEGDVHKLTCGTYYYVSSDAVFKKGTKSYVIGGKYATEAGYKIDKFSVVDENNDIIKVSHDYDALVAAYPGMKIAVHMKGMNDTPLGWTDVNNIIPKQNTEELSGGMHR